MKVFESDNLCEQSFHGIQIFGPGDSLIHTIDFTEDLGTSERLKHGTKWHYRDIRLDQTMVGFYGQVWPDGPIRSLGLKVSEGKCN